MLVFFFYFFLLFTQSTHGVCGFTGFRGTRNGSRDTLCWTKRIIGRRFERRLNFTMIFISFSFPLNYPLFNYHYIFLLPLIITRLGARKIQISYFKAIVCNFVLIFDVLLLFPLFVVLLSDNISEQKGRAFEVFESKINENREAKINP